MTHLIAVNQKLSFLTANSNRLLHLAMAAKQSTKRPNFLCNGQEINVTECDVKGNIPAWLNGHVMRNGPGEFDVGPDTFKHWFDGHTLIHKFDIANSKVTYQSTFMKNEEYKKNHSKGRIVVGVFGTPSIPDPCENVFSRFFTKVTTRKPNSDNCNVNIVMLGKTYYAITDGPMCHEIDPDTLDTTQFHNFHDKAGTVALCAHPHNDVNGDYYFIGLHAGRNGFYSIYKVPQSSFDKEDPITEYKIHTKIPNNSPLKPCYYHSFALSENYIAFHDQNVRLNVLKIVMSTFTWESLMTCFEHQPSRESVFHVVDKTKQELLPIKYRSKGRFCFHHANSFERTVNGRKYLIIDMLCADEPTFFYFWLKMLSSEDGKSERPHTLPYRFVLPIDVTKDTPTGKNLIDIEDSGASAVVRSDGSVFLTPELLVTDKLRDEFGCYGVELPTINYGEYNTKPYKYMYCIGEGRVGWVNQLVKINVETKEVKQWKEKDCHPSEPIFVKNPNSSDEDDGVVLSTVLSAIPGEPIYLLILDAKTFTELARAEIMTKLPYPLHGHFTGR